MNQISANLNQNNQQVPAIQQPGEIAIQVEVVTQSTNLSFNLSVDSQLPFNIFQEFVKEQIFAQQSQKTFENVLAYMLGQHTIEENNKQTLEQLQFRNGSVLKVNLKLKGGL